MNLKGERASSEIQRELSDILLTEIRDKDLQKVTITFVKVTDDLSFAKIYFTTLDENREKIVKDINNASGFFRKALADRLDIRHIPELRFVYDESIEYAQRLEKIIDKLN